MTVLTAGLLALSLAGCKEEVKITEAEAGTPLSTMFFDYTVNNAYTESTLGDKSTYEGYQFLIVDLSIKNTTEDSITMSDGDFWISWGEGEYDHDAAISAYGEDPLLDDELESVYELPAMGDIRGTLVFIVPNDKKEFGLKAEDYYTTSESSEPVTGDTFTVTFTIDDAGKIIMPEKPEEGK